MQKVHRSVGWGRIESRWIGLKKIIRGIVDAWKDAINTILTYKLEWGRGRISGIGASKEINKKEQ